jgi:hypothetical protein
MALNSKHRTRWISDIIAEVQRCLSKSKDQPEAPLLQKALNTLDDARQKARESTDPQ